MKESEIRKALKERVESLGGEVRAVSWLGRRHAPDVLCLFPQTPLWGAHHIFVETKRPGKTATAAQAREHQRLRDAGCIVRCTSTIEELDAWIPPR